MIEVAIAVGIALVLIGKSRRRRLSPVEMNARLVAYREASFMDNNAEPTKRTGATALTLYRGDGGSNPIFIKICEDLMGLDVHYKIDGVFVSDDLLQELEDEIEIEEEKSRDSGSPTPELNKLIIARDKCINSLDNRIKAKKLMQRMQWMTT